VKQRVLFDSDVLLDVFLQRQPHAAESIKIVEGFHELLVGGGGYGKHDQTGVEAKFR
jgi:hypothetical protein